MSINAEKNLYIDIDVDKHLQDNIVVNIELLRNSHEYSEYVETKLISIHNQEKYSNSTRKIDLDNSFVYELFVNYKNRKFFSISKDQIYDHYNTDVKNKFKILEIDNQIYLLDYGLYKKNENYGTTFDTYLLEEKKISELPDSRKFTYSSDHDRFIIQPMDMDSINYFSKLSYPELEEFKFILSDQKKIEELKAQ
ncbi:MULTISPECIES: hypothetical protein [Psychrobacter]|uniref:hypothetical protein n=1 Tax=Psychrobacter TaxID=497 RepID=UPI0012EB14E5|nr:MULTISPECIES: hypothetical protein [Psychrobacter]NRD71627.1 hypothetical protein [Psychrobacter okhotskensis]